MGFDWNKLDGPAKTLALRSDDASQRTATNRVYYRAYHLARKRIEEATGRKIERGFSSHDRLWSIYASVNTTESLQIFEDGKLVKSYRHNADYDDDVSDCSKEHVLARALVDRIIATLPKVSNADFAKVEHVIGTYLHK